MDTHAREAEEFARTLRHTKAGREALDSCQQLLEDPDQKDFTDAVGQPYDGWTDGQLSALGQIAVLQQGRGFDVVRIRVGVAPSSGGHPDIDRVRLARLPKYFVPLVYDRPTPEGDGMLSWHPSVQSTLHCGWVSTARLSIGYADASMTLLHLMQRGAVARWPYGGQDVWVFGFTSFTSWLSWKQEI